MTTPIDNESDDNLDEICKTIVDLDARVKSIQEKDLIDLLSNISRTIATLQRNDGDGN